MYNNDAKTPKTPPISSATKLLSFDLETNGLHGDAFAVGAMIMDSKGQIHEQFAGRSRLTSKVDPWVKANVLPAIVEMPISHKDSRELREAFWHWYLEAEAKSDYVLVNNGYPVEYRFLIQCQEENLDERYWHHPFPILDLFSLLIQVGYRSTSSRNKLIADVVGQEQFLIHNPLHDAKLAALAAFKAFELSGQLK